MSKAMDALKALEDRIIPFRLIEKGSPGADAISTLRDYITTTEAKGEALAITAGNLMMERADSVARIKELEEALIDAISVMKFYAISPPQTPSQTPQRMCDKQAYTLIEKIEKIMAMDEQTKSALSGARKVGA